MTGCGFVDIGLNRAVLREEKPKRFGGKDEVGQHNVGYECGPC